MKQNATLRLIEAALLGFVGIVTRHPRLIATLVLGLSALSMVYAAQNLRIDAETSNMLAPELPYRQAQQAFNDAFPEAANNIIIVVAADSADEADAFSSRLSERLNDFESMEDVFFAAGDPFFASRGLLFLNIADLEARLSQINRAASLLTALSQDPSLVRLLTVLNQVSAQAANAGPAIDMTGDELDNAYRAVAESIDAAAAGERRPLSWQALLDPNGTEDAVIRVINVRPQLDFSDIQPARRALGDIRMALAELETEGVWDVEVGITGKWALRTEELRSVTQGIGLSFGFSLICVTLLLILAFRSAAFTITTFTVILCGLALTAGFTALTIGALNLISVAFTVLLLGLGVDFAIHFGLHVQERLRQGMSPANAVPGAIRDVGVPLALCMPTTAFAFLAFVPTEFIGMAQLGIIAGAGVLLTFIVSMALIAAAAVLAPPPKPRRKPTKSGGLLALLVRRFGGALTVLAIVLTFAALWLMPQVRFDADPMSLRDPASPSVLTFNRLRDEGGQPVFRLDALAADQEAADALAARLKDIPEVASAVTLSDFVPADQALKIELIGFTADGLLFDIAEPGQAAPPTEESLIPAIDRLIETLAAAEGNQEARRLRQALETLRDSLDSGVSVAAEAQRQIFRFWPDTVDRLIAQLTPEEVVADDIPATIRQRFVNQDGIARVEILPHDDAGSTVDQARFVDAVAALVPDVSGDARTIEGSSETVSFAMLQATATAIIVVAALLWLLLRDGFLVLLILLPLAMAGILTSATGVLIDQPYNFANIIVLPLLIGLGIDSGIHIALRGQAEKSGIAALETVTPRAIFFSTLTTIAAFGSLMLSDHRGTASMGQLLAIAIGFALICVLIVLPVTLDWLNRRRLRRGGTRNGTA